jgi:N-methylhydantoinase B/oxoprolinase/acetone carboxylase alpha subunit
MEKSNINNTLNIEKDKYSIDFKNIKSVINYIINHYEKFLLLILVFVIVYIIEHITIINTAIFGATQIPIPGASSSSSQKPDQKTRKPQKKQKK